MNEVKIQDLETKYVSVIITSFRVKKVPYLIDKSFCLKEHGRNITHTLKEQIGLEGNRQNILHIMLSLTSFEFLKQVCFSWSNTGCHIKSCKTQQYTDVHIYKKRQRLKKMCNLCPRGSV